MSSSKDGGRNTFAVLWLALVWFALASPASAQSQSSTDKEEEFEKVDPYTRGNDAALAKLDYAQFGPFLFFDKVTTEKVEEALGGVRVLWVETPHFKIGSCLRTYKQDGDPTEDKKLEDECRRFRSRLPSARTPSNKLDPWLRLHLFAQRLEDQYADFQRRFGIAPAMVPATDTTARAGTHAKIAVLLTDRQSAVARFYKTFFALDTDQWRRWRTNEHTAIFAISVESLKTFTYERDADLHATVASEMAQTFLESFREGALPPPLWLGAGLGHFYARGVDERSAMMAGATRDKDDLTSYNWEPRVYGLAYNKVAKPWKDMALCSDWGELKAQGHLVAWSRVSWLLARKDTDLRALALALTSGAPDVPDAERARVEADRHAAAFKSVFGKTLDELDAEWRRYVLKTYDKN